jgi:dCMP deaminase
MTAISKWNYFMSLAFLSARRSKDPSTQVGACIANRKGRVVGMGYNGFVNGCKNDFTWEREGDGWAGTKYPFVVHAEVNAVLNATGPVEGSSIYCTLYPCNICAQVIVQAGIKKVVYFSDKYHDADFTKQARLIFRKAEIDTCDYNTFEPILNIEFGPDIIEI